MEKYKTEDGLKHGSDSSQERAAAGLCGVSVNQKRCSIWVDTVAMPGVIAGDKVQAGRQLCLLLQYSVSVLCTVLRLDIDDKSEMWAVRMLTRTS